jgi:hypothetical protein
MRVSSSRPAIPSAGHGERTYYEFQGKFYWDNDDLTTDQVHALLVMRDQAQQRRIDRAQAVVAIGTKPAPTARAAIPDDVSPGHS